MTGIQRSTEVFRRLGGDEAAAVARRDFTELTEESSAAFERVCLALYSSKPGWAEESRQWLARYIQTTDVNVHYYRHEVPRFDPWSLLPDIRCPVLILAGEDDPLCPLPVVEDLARQLPADTTRLVRVAGARHTIFATAQTSLSSHQELRLSAQGKGAFRLSLHAQEPAATGRGPRHV